MTREAGAHDLRPEGKISHCDACVAECNYFCCDFDPDPDSGNFMVMYPGEFEAAIASGWDMSNVEILGHDADGGIRFTTPHRLCCQLPNPAATQAVNAKGYYKSFECRVYPLWPYLHNDEWRFRISMRCPIHKRDLDLVPKIDEILAEVNALVADPHVRRWFTYQRCAGTYREYPTKYDSPRQVVVMPPDVTPSSIVYPVVVNGRMAHFGVRACDERVIAADQRRVVSELVLACIVADNASAEYINVYQPVSRSLHARLRDVAVESSSATVFPIVRAMQHEEKGNPLGITHERVPLSIVAHAAALDGHLAPDAPMHAARRALLAALT